MTNPGPVRKILVFVDGSEECITAAQYAIALAKFTQAEVTAVYVVNTSLLDELVKARIFIKMEHMDYEQDMEQDGRRYLNYITEMAGAKNVSVQTVLLKGVVNQEVVRTIGERGIDLLIMGELGTVRSRSDTYHDEAELILRKAKCSVMVVKAPDRVERLYNAMEQD